ncbi:MAG: hypothetical protein SF123_02190, partial [Chloroflexota bacterium]|nr:hypothetical protein [Chloroflexota bacterium]
IRSGQEVSIVNERKALQRLAGHPALATLLGGGQFFVSGIVHQYIVIERAQGALVADMVREQAARGERLPELELLVIVDALLDLLHAAHAKDIIYNDVDAKHLFWDRERHRLKVIDWGNAVFLEGDEATPQGISRQSDVFQVGELLYFLVTGGQRAEIARDAGEDFALNFGDDTDRLSPRLQAIISKAAHPNTRFRYRTLDDLRKELTEYRAPLQRERDSIISRVFERLQGSNSKERLHDLLHMLEPALMMDPGYPQARAAFSQIEDQLSDLEVAGDLDAARIYLESANWARASALLDELRGKTRGDTATLIKLLRDWARMLEQTDLRPTPLAVMDAIALAFEGDYAACAQALLTQNAGDERVRILGWLLAERVAAHVPEVIVLRPNLYRLELALDELEKDGARVTEVKALLDQIMDGLDTLFAPPAKGKRKKAATAATIDLIALRDGYRNVVDQLMQLGMMLDSSTVGETVTRRLPIGIIERASNAAMTLADNMHVVGKQAVSDPRDALAALNSSRQVDPGNPAWELLQKLLDGLYELLQTYQTYIPAADGSDLADWLAGSTRDLQPFNARLFDEMLAGIIAGLEKASASWTRYADAAVTGGKTTAISALTDAIDAVSTVSPTLAGWLNQLRSVVSGAGYVERYALHGALGRALADGWEAFDRGRFADAERLAAQAFEAGRRDVEQEAARRLRDLAEMARGWVERSGVGDVKRTEAALNRVESLLTMDERAALQQFSAQMPNREVYLRAMGKGLVESFGRSSSAAVRLLFTQYLLQATLDAHNNALDTTDFWREAALKTLPDASRHPLTRTLDEFLERRRDLTDAAATLNAIDHPSRLSSLDRARKALEDNRQAKLLQPGVYSLRELEAATRDWADGEFRAAGIKLDNAVKALDDIETNAGITLTNYRAWLMTLIEGAAELHTTLRRMQGIIEARPDAPDDVLRTGHRTLVATTERLLGANTAATLRQWRDTYEQFLAAYTDKSARRSARLNRFNDLFRALFIDRHPAYPLYRHWYSVTDAAPEFPAPPTDEPTPYVRDEDADVGTQSGDGHDAGAHGVGAQSIAPLQDQKRRGIPRLLLFGVPLLVIAGIVGFLLLNNANPPADITPTAAAANLTAEPSPGGAGSDSTNSTSVTALPEGRPTASAEGGTGVRATPTVTSTPETPAPLVNPLPTRPTDTPTITQTPSATPTPTASQTRTPTSTATASVTPTASQTPLPAEGIRGVQNVLTLLPLVDDPAWTSEQFGLAEDGVSWRLGSGAAPTGNILNVALPGDAIDTALGNNAPARIISMEADVRLITYNPSLQLSDGVFFGLAFQDVGNPLEQAGVQINLVEGGVVNIGQVVDGVNSVVSQRSLGEVRLRLRIDRNPDSGVLTTFVNGEPVGLPITQTTPQGVLPVLFVNDGGVIVYVGSWTIVLR